MIHGVWSDYQPTCNHTHLLHLVTSEFILRKVPRGDDPNTVILSLNIHLAGDVKDASALLARRCSGVSGWRGASVVARDTRPRLSLARAPASTSVTSVDTAPPPTCSELRHTWPWPMKSSRRPQS